MGNYQRSLEGEARRLASIPKGKEHWHYSDNPTVAAIHRWLNNWYGRAYKCESAKHDYDKPVKKFDYALIHGKPYAKERKNFKMLCRSCHLKYDFTDERRKKPRIQLGSATERSLKNTSFGVR
jgi:hypothetical protein